jgi:hypothetical protein
MNTISKVCVNKCLFVENLIWESFAMFRCNGCDFIFQNIYKELNYSANYCVKAIGPDGQERDLTKERDFKIKNWYGGCTAPHLSSSFS